MYVLIWQLLIFKTFSITKADTVQRRENQLDFLNLENKTQELILILFNSFGIHKNQKIRHSIDITEFIYYGKNQIPIVAGTKPQNNTHKSTQFFTASILTDAYIIPVYNKAITSKYP